MGIPDSSLQDLIEKVRSWISWGTNQSLPSSLSGDFQMEGDNCMNCWDCKVKILDSCLKYHCQSCDRVLCGDCMKRGSSCKLCSDMNVGYYEGGKKNYDKIYPSESPRESPEPSSPSFNGERIDDCSPYALTNRPSPVVVRCSPSRSDEYEGDDSTNHFFSPSSVYWHDTSDMDSSSVSTRHDFYWFKSVESSPSDSPSGIHIRVGRSEQRETPNSQNGSPFGQQPLTVLKKPETSTTTGTDDQENTDDCTDNLSIFPDPCQKSHKTFNFENNDVIWLPPPPDDEAENGFCAYDDEDDEIGESGGVFSSSGSLSSMFPGKEKQNEDHREPLKAVVQGHFRALVSQLLEGEGIKFDKENERDNWLDIVTSLASQAANFVRPDTSRGGSMDPSDYVKVKCVASGSPRESFFVRGVVCTKNIKHKRMTSQYKTPRLLLLGGALEYQRVPNQLASFDTLLQQEMDQLKMIVSKIEAHHPNVLLVEKSVSSYAQEYLLAKEISLVLNVKRPLLERIARCTGAHITPNIDNISLARLGHCELFRLEKIAEGHEPSNQFSKKPCKTLMFFEGCPRRLGCTVLLKGSCRKELKKVKHVVQYAVFAAYHLSLETSFLADEGATLPKMTIEPSLAIPERTTPFSSISLIPNSSVLDFIEGPLDSCLDREEVDSSPENPTKNRDSLLTNGFFSHTQNDDLDDAGNFLPLEIRNHMPEELPENGTGEVVNFERNDEAEVSSEYYSSVDSHQSILVSFSSRCVLNGTVCELSRQLRIKFYGIFDKPLGRYLRDELFDQASFCRSCKEPVDAHVMCYTHQQGNLTINVRRLSSVNLSGECDGKIWMWHRCLKCAHTAADGVPPATRRVVMSDDAWGLSFGKFLELSFSNHATANRIASCGHSLQRDCLRFYGFGNMVAFFRYSPIDILSVHLPPSILEFNGHFQQERLRNEAAELLSKMEGLYAEISGAIDSIEQKSGALGEKRSDLDEPYNHIFELKDLLMKEKNDCILLLQPSDEEESISGQAAIDILELNRLRHNLLISLHAWDRRLYSLNSLLETKDSKSHQLHKDGNVANAPEENTPDLSEQMQEQRNLLQPKPKASEEGEIQSDGEIAVQTSLERAPSAASALSEKIDSAWAGTDQPTSKAQLPRADGPDPTMLNPSIRRVTTPARGYSFDSAVRVQELRKGLPPSSLYLSTIRSFHALGEYKNMVRDPVSNIHRTYSQILPREAQKLNFLMNTPHLFRSSLSLLPEGGRLMLPQNGQNNFVITVYDNEPTSIISYALGTKEYENWVSDRSNGAVPGPGPEGSPKFSTWQSFGSLDLDYIHYGSYGSEDPKSSSSPHLRINFEDESLNGVGKVKFSVTCYLAKQFDRLRKKCCPNKLDFLRSLSRCKRWSAQGGKSNVYFAKTLDERFIVKQVTKTELESFEEFAPEYFKYLTDSLGSRSPTCLAKVLGIYQVTVKNLKGGKETKMDLMVMENLFFKRNISRVYDLKGSVRSRYNSDTTGTNKVLLDMNLIETLRTEPIFLGTKAKRSLERAVWNDTSFLASVDVMDYSLLVGVDEERKELVIGIIDFMRQYTWDKHLETWVKASGILGGPKNASPTIISPKQYKKRFRKKMTTYFLRVPDQWSS